MGSEAGYGLATEVYFMGSFVTFLDDGSLRMFVTVLSFFA